VSDEERSLRVAFESEESLQREYQTNIANGGIFIATNVGFAAREVVRVEIALEYCDRRTDLGGRYRKSAPDVWYLCARGNTDSHARR